MSATASLSSAGVSPPDSRGTSAASAFAKVAPKGCLISCATDLKRTCVQAPRTTFIMSGSTPPRASSSTRR